MGRLCLTLCIAVVALLLSLGGNGGCQPAKPKQTTLAPVHRPGDPVQEQTAYYIIRNGERVYFLNEEEMKMALSRTP